MHTKSNLMQNLLISIRCTRPDPREVNQHLIFHWLISVHILLHLPLDLPLDIPVILGLLCVGPLQGTLLGPPLHQCRYSL